MKTEKVTQYIIEWLKDYLIDNNLKGFVVGISGGVDSAVVSALCGETGYPVLSVEMPIHQSDSEISRSSEHIKWLKKKYENTTALHIDLTDSFETFKNNLPKGDNPSKLDLALANSRARLRMTTLYYLAGQEDLVVVGTGNKIEDFGIGFYTKYGDGGVDISPIADLTKSQVYQIGEHLEINYDILKVKPTDGLFGDSRTDEDQIGATYPELEWAMQAFEKGVNEKDLEGRQLDVFKIYKFRHQANKHKWEPIPVCKIPAHLLK